MFYNFLYICILVPIPKSEVLVLNSVAAPVAGVAAPITALMATNDSAILAVVQ